MSTSRSDGLRVGIVGATGLKVSRLGLGTMTWGRDTDEHEARDQLIAFAEAGGSLVDTAAGYGDGASEELIGSLIGGRMLDRARPLAPVALCFAAAAAALLMLAMLPANLALMLLGGTLVGGAILCVQAILYGIAPQCYPFEIRGTGVGTAVAVGRLGSIAGPLLAGALVTAGFTPSDVMMALVPITLAAGLTTVLLLMRRRAAPVPA